MLTLTKPVDPNGLLLEVFIHLDKIEMSRLLARGQPLPPPISARGLIDTGTDVTGVVPTLLRQMPFRLIARTTTQTVAGTLPVHLYEVSLSIVGPPGAGLMFTRPTLVVMELVSPLTDADVLIGRDILEECLLVLNGPGKQFTLAC